MVTLKVVSVTNSQGKQGNEARLLILSFLVLFYFWGVIVWNKHWDSIKHIQLIHIARYTPVSLDI